MKEALSLAMIEAAFEISEKNLLIDGQPNPHFRTFS